MFTNMKKGINIDTKMAIRIKLKENNTNKFCNLSGNN